MARNKRKNRIANTLAVCFWLCAWQAASVCIGQKLILVSPLEVCGALLALLPGCTVVLPLIFWYILFSTAVIIRPHAVRTILTFVLVAAAAARQPFFSVRMGVVLIAAAVIWRHLPALRGQQPALILLGHTVWTSRHGSPGERPMRP